jgi:hypothetical protein
MKSHPHPYKLPAGVTLVEMSLVLMLLLALIGTGLFVSNKYTEWKLGREASLTLQSVHAAQRMFLADNPTALVTEITSTRLIPYLPNRATTMPTIKSLTGANLPIIITVMPPVANGGGGVAYDPSGSTKDSLWDVGE